MQSIEQILEFLVEAEKLKAVLRNTRPVGLDRYENPAEHSWREHFVPLETIVDVNSRIGKASQKLWDVMRNKIESAVRKGLLD